ncbi:MAG: orotidine 5'-phosphate decarboxylase [Bacteroidetes bacterium CG2_30_32_10]|nr:MAG: orotidine 5'-phosphate decarboxylase [Bacteroidetes bacterium CG2_30_32_10]
MNKLELFDNIKKKKSFLCVGLDTDITKIPKHLLQLTDPVFEFNKQIIDATIEYAVAYKPNTAFYECLGTKGWESLEKTIQYLNQIKDRPFVIADAKRGDIGNTSTMYAKAFFEQMNVDAITVSPYMGSDSVKPFLTFKDKWAIILALTSNEGASDFQYSSSEIKTQLFETILEKGKKWGNENNMMWVVGATKAEMLKTIRNIVPNHFLLIPGIGNQGGNLREVVKNGLNKQCGLIVNASRSIIYAGNKNDFAQKSTNEAKKVQKEMEQLLYQYNLL